jgi:hypothetical protein
MQVRDASKVDEEVRLPDASSAEVLAGNFLGYPEDSRAASVKGLKVRVEPRRVRRHGGEP